MKKITSIFILFVLIISLISCGSSYNESSKDISGYAAITVAKNSSWVQSEIADEYGLKFFHKPDWGTCTYDENASGVWEVTLKGTISGYTDDYKTDYEYDLKFTANVQVSSKGNILSVRVSSY